MKTQPLREALADMASLPDFLGCALVDMQDGMVCHAVGSLAELEQVVSYSSDYWRLNQRNQPVFEGLGDLRVVVLMHRAGQITLSECGKRMLLVLVTRRLSAIDWDRWKTDHTRLATLVNQL